jgi:hypothetical protein
MDYSFITFVIIPFILYVFLIIGISIFKHWFKKNRITSSKKIMGQICFKCDSYIYESFEKYLSNIEGYGLTMCNKCRRLDKLNKIDAGKNRSLLEKIDDICNDLNTDPKITNKLIDLLSGTFIISITTTIIMFENTLLIAFFFYNFVSITLINHKKKLISIKKGSK